MHERDGMATARHPQHGNHEWTRMDTNENKQVGRSGVRPSQTQSNPVKPSQTKLNFMNMKEWQSKAAGTWKPRMNTDGHRWGGKRAWFQLTLGTQLGWSDHPPEQLHFYPCASVSIRG